MPRDEASESAAVSEGPARHCRISIGESSEAHLLALKDAFAGDVADADPREASDDELIARLLGRLLGVIPITRREGRQTILEDFQRRVRLAEQSDSARPRRATPRPAPLDAEPARAHRLSIDGINSSTEQYICERVEETRRYLSMSPFARQSHNVAKVADDVLTLVIVWFEFTKQDSTPLTEADLGQQVPDDFLVELRRRAVQGRFSAGRIPPDASASAQHQPEVGVIATAPILQPADRLLFLNERQISPTDAFWTHERISAAIALGL